MKPDPSSFRDPSGYVFHMDGKLYRQVNHSAKEDYDQLMSSGLYKELTHRKWMVTHEQLDQNLTGDNNWFTTLLPERVAFISYAWEWSFHMLKDAALLTLDLQSIAISKGLSLKDATPFNIQFHEGRPLLIDSLSFETYEETKPWVAYRQFCEQFLAPLALMHYTKISLQQLFLAYPEGIPLSLASRLLPFRSRFSLHTYLHIHLNAQIGNRKGSSQGNAVPFSRKKMEDILRSLRQLILRFELKAYASTWSDYYTEAATRKNYLPAKKTIISEWIDELAPEISNASDLGANDGEFSSLLAGRNIPCLAADLDPNCIDRLYFTMRDQKNRFLQPVIMDLSHPSPAIGFNNEERRSFLQRGTRDMVLALALIHHLAIGKNIPLGKIASLFAALTGKWLIIEFVPKQDEKVQFMLAGRKDIFPDYDRAHFESAFSAYFTITKTEAVPDSERTLYLMQRNLY